MGDNAHHAKAALAATLLLLSACSSDSTDSGPDAEQTSTSEDARPMIVDYSPTLSDVPALMFLATRPDIDLLAVTLPGTGEADCEEGVRQTRALLVIAGHPDTPVGCGRDEPMEGTRDWPEAWREAANHLTGILLPGVEADDPVDAEKLLAATLGDADEPVMIVTLGPLTNVGLVLEKDPSLAEHVDSIVTMGGAFDVAGNVDASPLAEWNLHVDPASVRAVLDSGVPVTFVGLDATSAVPGNAGIYARLADTATTGAGEAVRQLWSAHLETVTSDGWYLWDELAAVAAIEPSVVTISDRRVFVEDSGATVTGDEGVMVGVATGADAAEFERVFLEAFAGGTLPTRPELTAAEQRYLDDMTRTMSGFVAQLDQAFVSMDDQVGSTPTDEVMGDFANTLFGGLRDMHSALHGTIPPAEYRADHDDMMDITAEILAAEPEFLHAVVVGAPTDPVTDELFWSLLEQADENAGMFSLFDDFNDACRRLELKAFARGATAEICVQD